MKKVLLIMSVVLLALVGIYWKGKALVVEAERETRWLRDEMWVSAYFNPSNLHLSESREVFIRNAGTDFTARFGTGYLKENVCDEETSTCTERRLALSNILINEGNLDQAKIFENLAAKYYVDSKSCSVMLETTLVRHIIKVTKKMKPDSARQRAASALQRIKMSGGIHSDLRNETCNRMAMESPIIFHNYVMIIAELMDHAGGEKAEHAAYLRKINKVTM
ncbi:hypothetical protein [Pelagibacterium sp.]|uniref:hypothetical protein n=1 Tax=Pelagibacterium sp. TaxID=1967288 RepID=UPI003A8EF31A